MSINSLAGYGGRVVAFCLLWVLLPAAAWGQQPAFNSVVVPYAFDSGVHLNGANRLQMVATHTIYEPGAAGLRVFFSDLTFGVGDFVEVSGTIVPGNTHRISLSEAAKWGDSSAYFNGDTITLKLFLQPGSMGRFVVSQLDEGISPFGTDTICGTVDNRAPISDNRVFRILSSGTGSGGCTGWLASSDDCGVTAGHCATCCTGVAEFNVPLSTGSGAIQHPPVADQFPILASSVVYVAGGVGNDFAVYTILPNILGQSASALHGWFQVGNFLPAPGDIIRVTGFGAGGGQLSQTNRTHTGPSVPSLGTQLRYVVDTTGGNSGSPVIHEATGEAVGVHTHGGCTAVGGSNSGTSFTLAAFNAAHQASCAQSGLFLDLSTTGGGMQDLHLAVLNLPQGTVQGFTLFSLDTSSVAGSGPLLGLDVDNLTLHILTQPGSVGDPLHWVTPFLPGSWPTVPLDFPAGSVPFLAGTSIDGVAVALGSSWALLGASPVVRITF